MPTFKWRVKEKGALMGNKQREQIRGHVKHAQPEALGVEGRMVFNV